MKNSDNLALAPTPKTARVLSPVRALGQGQAILGHDQVPKPRINPYLLLLETTRTPATRRTYAANVTRFCRDVYGQDPDMSIISEFLSQSRPEMSMQLSAYKNALKASGAASSSINVRLAAIRSLVDVANKNGFCEVTARDLVKSAKAETYRDTRGPGMEVVKQLLALPDRTTIKGKRDYALLRMLANNALRRAEAWGLDVKDFEPDAKRIAVLGKGHDDKVFVTLDPATIAAITDYLSAAGHTEGAILRSCAFRQSVKGKPLSYAGVYDVVRAYGRKIGMKLKPHQFRHYAITTALEAANGDVARVQKMSRHKNVATVMIYNDNRTDHQGAITTMLADLLDS